MATYVEYNATMATASMTMASHSVDINPSVMSTIIDQHVESREESVEKLKANLVRYARSNDRRMVLRSLKDVNFLSFIPLEAPVVRNGVSVSELETGAYMEKVVLNGTLLSPPTQDTDIKNIGTNSGCVMIIKGLTKALSKTSDLDQNSLYKQVLLRLAKSFASEDIYDLINSMMGSEELIVKTLSSDHSIKNRNKGESSGDPSDLRLYNSGGQIHMIVDSTFNFGLFRKGETTGRPWILIECKVHERTNLSNNECFRSLNVKTPNLY